MLTLAGAGRTTLTVSAEEVSTDVGIEVLPNPVASITLTGAPAEVVPTGDVVFFEASATDASGNAVPDYPIQFATFGIPADGIVAPGAIGQVDEEGAFVAERSGTHTVIADGFTQSASATVAVVARNVRKDVEIVGQGPVRDRYTSDLWVWEGIDGRDYAVTGTWGADGHAYFWDVTDPSAMALIDTVRVDARTVNDVKVSEDGKFCVISREGASNRKNGLVILDVSDPQNGDRGHRPLRRPAHRRGPQRLHRRGAHLCALRGPALRHPERRGSGKPLPGRALRAGYAGPLHPRCVGGGGDRLHLELG